MRHMYTGKDRAQLVSKMTTRIPYELRSQLKAVTSWPPFGYRTQTQMYTKCLVDFIRLKPWATAGLNWRGSSRADQVTPLFHIHLEPTEVSGKEITGPEIKDRALELAEEAGVNQATFVLTFLWWVALYKHPIDGTMDALMNVKGANV